MEDDFVKCDMLKEITDHFEWYQDQGNVVLQMQSRTLTQWLHEHLKKIHPDELALYALSHLYNRHTVVFGRGRPWCTIRPTGDPMEADFVTSCQVHLLYLGEYIFAPLTPRKRTVSPEFPLFMPDQANTVPSLLLQNSDANDNHDFVEVTKEIAAGGSYLQDTHRHKTVAGALSSYDKAVSKKEPVTSTSTGKKALHSEQDYDMKSSNTEQNTDMLTSGNATSHKRYDHKYDCFVTLRKLTADIITKSTQTTSDSVMTLRARKPKCSTRHPRLASMDISYTGMDDDDYLEYEPDTKKRKSTIAPGPGSSSVRLRAQQLISKQRVILNTTDDDVTSSNEDDTSSGVSAPIDISQKDVLKVTETETTTDTPVASTSKGTSKDTTSEKVGKLVVHEHKLVKTKRVRSFKCIVCQVVTHSTMEYNKHYSANHPPLNCQDCSRTFTNPMSLQRHRYNHTKTEGVYPCNRCDKVFPFGSQLQSHKFSHRRIAHFPCSGKGCKKVFMRKSDLAAHAEAHKKIKHDCDKCTYTTFDKRYLKQHKRVHSDTYKYCCETCGKGFWFYQQYKRHNPTNCEGGSESEEY